VTADQGADQGDESDSILETDDREQDQRDVPPMPDPLKRPKRRFPCQQHQENSLRAD